MELPADFLSLGRGSVNLVSDFHSISYRIVFFIMIFLSQPNCFAKSLHASNIEKCD